MRKKVTEGGECPLYFSKWMRYAEKVGYGVLGLKPWELGRLSPLELEKMLNGHILRMKSKDMKQAYYACMMTNVHIPKAKDRVKIKDIMHAFYPPTLEDKKREEQAFMMEFEEERKRLKGGD